MDLKHAASDEQFRQQARLFIGTKMAALGSESSPGSDRIQAHKARVSRWSQMLDDGGYLVHSWPTEWGGATWPRTWHRILQDEMIAARTPQTDSIGVGFVGPMLCKFGSPAQKARHLPRIRRAADFWCQGFSEAHAGSDTMAIRTRATRGKSEFTVNGQKLWTSNAHFADMMFTLVKSEGPNGRPLSGLTLLLIDMRTPGVTVRPVILIDGNHLVNEVTLDNVRVPFENLIGEEGKGWIYARSILADERTIVANLAGLKLSLKGVRNILSEPDSAPVHFRRCSTFGARLAEIEAELEALEFMELRLLHAPQGDASAQLFPAMLKLRASELSQKLSALTLEALGERALEMPGTSSADAGMPAPPIYFTIATSHFLSRRAATILGGTSEIQRNVIAGVGFGI